MGMNPKLPGTYYTIESFTDDRGSVCYFRKDHRSAYHSIFDAQRHSRGWPSSQPSNVIQKWLVREYRDDYNSVCRDMREIIDAPIGDDIDAAIDASQEFNHGRF